MKEKLLIEIIDDSEEERIEPRLQPRRKTISPSAIPTLKPFSAGARSRDDLFDLSSTSESERGRNEGGLSGGSIATTSRFFGTTGSKEKEKSRPKPWDKLKPKKTRAHKIIEIKNTDGRPSRSNSTGSTTSSSKRLSDSSPAEKKAVKRRKSDEGEGENIVDDSPGAQFRSASSILLENRSIMAEALGSEYKGKGKMEFVDDSIEIIGGEEWEEEFNLAPRSARDQQRFARTLHGLPQLLPSTTTTTNRQPKVEIKFDPDDEGSNAQRFRGGLDQFKFGNDPLPLLTTTTKQESKLSAMFAKKLAPPKPIDLPPNPHITSLESCPLCHEIWSTTKTLATKSTHLKKCAVEQDYTSETVRVLVENYVILRAASVVKDRRETESERALFDRAVGKGEGISVSREVRVVGVEIEGDGGWGQKDPNRLEMVQQEIDDGRVKKRVDRALKLAGEIKATRRAEKLRIAAMEKEARALVRKLEMGESDEVEYDPTQAEAMPRPTGKLQGVSVESTRGAANKAALLLDALGGTGLTQSNFLSRGNGGDDDIKPVILPSQVAPLEIGTASLDLASQAFVKLLLEPLTTIIISDDDESFPPPTQLFAPSKIAQEFSTRGRGEVFTAPLKEFQMAVVTRCANPALGGETRSLWNAAGGTDRKTIDQVVISLSSSPPPILSSPSPPSSPMFVDSSKDRQTPVSPIRGEEEMRMSGSLAREGVLVWDGMDSDDAVEGWGGGRRRVGEGDERENEWREIEIGDSSDEEELPDIVVAVASKYVKGKGKEREDSSESPKSKSKSPKKSTTAKANNAALALDMPDYTTWTLPQLQTEVAKYGFKISKSKKVVVGQLQDCWTALHPTIVVESAPKKTRKKKVVEEEGEIESIAERLRKLIVGEEELYLKILRYEPIYFEDFVRLVAENKIKCARPVLQRCLDEQSITFYTQDPTNGTRKRFA